MFYANIKFSQLRKVWERQMDINYFSQNAKSQSDGDTAEKERKEDYRHIMQLL